MSLWQDDYIGNLSIKLYEYIKDRGNMNGKNMYYGITAGLAFAGGLMSKLLGGWDKGLEALCVVMVIDYLTGIFCALIWKASPKTEGGAFDSKANIKGLFKKIACLFCVMMCHRIDIVLGSAFLRDSIILFFIANDGFSIIENLGLMGVPLPEKIKAAFSLLKDKGEK